MRTIDRSDQLVQLQLHSRAVSILGVLDEEYHQESDDGGASVYDQLPGVAEPEDRTGNSPNQDDKHGDSESSRMPCGTRSPLGKVGEQGVVVHRHRRTPLIAILV